MPPVNLLHALTCGPECSRARVARRVAAGPALPGWRCASCGCSLARANRKRWNRDLPPMKAGSGRVCLPDCAETVARLNPSARRKSRPRPV